MDIITTLLSWIKDIVDILQSGCSIVAIIIGGIWGYWLFIKNRQKYPRACVAHQIYSKEIVENKIFLRITITISNTGNVLLSLSSLFTRIQQVAPLPTDLVEHINSGNDPVQIGNTEIGWPLLDSRNINFNKGEYEIEPGECQEIQCDFILDAPIDTISIYSYLENEVKHGREIGWDSTTLYNFDNKEQSKNV